MAKIKVGIVEDEMIIAQGIIRALKDLGYETTEPALSYTEALGMIVSEQPDILLLDIQLKGHKDGIELAQKIKTDYNIPYIFLTANGDSATVERAKQLNPPAYLIKPFNKTELYASIEICLHNFSAGNAKSPEAEKDDLFIKDSLFIKHGQHYLKIRTAEIMYLESDNNYVNVYTTNNKLMVRNSIQGYLDIIGNRQFIRVHKSYAVNTEFIDSVNADSIFIKGVEIPIGRAHKEELMAFLRLG